MVKRSGNVFALPSQKAAARAAVTRRPAAVKVHTVELDYERTHTATHRYKVPKGTNLETVPLDTAYLQKALMQDPTHPPRRVRITVEYLD